MKSSLSFIFFAAFLSIQPLHAQDQIDGTIPIEILRQRGVLLVSDSHAYAIKFSCTNEDCSRVQINYGWAPGVISVSPKTNKSIEVDFNVIEHFAQTHEIPKSYYTPGFNKAVFSGEMIDKDAGVFNVVLLFIVPLGYLYNGIHDSAVKISNSNTRLLDFLQSLKKDLEKANADDASRRINFSKYSWLPSEFDNYIKLVENAIITHHQNR